MVFLDNVECGGKLVLQIIKFIFSLLDIVLILVPIGLIIMVMIDFVKNVIANGSNDMKGNVSIASRRIIFCMAIFLIDPIVKTSISLLGDIGVDYAKCINIARTENLNKYQTKFEDENYKVDINEDFVDIKQKEKKKKKGSSLTKNDEEIKLDIQEPTWKSKYFKSYKDGGENPYPYGFCTWFVWGMVYQNTGVVPPFGWTTNNSKFKDRYKDDISAWQIVDYITSSSDSQWEKAEVPVAGAIASIKNPPTIVSHTAYIMSCDGTNVTYMDANMNNTAENSLEEFLHLNPKDYRKGTAKLSDLKAQGWTFANPKT